MQMKLSIGMVLLSLMIYQNSFVKPATSSKNGKTLRVKRAVFDIIPVYRVEDVNKRILEIGSKTGTKRVPERKKVNKKHLRNLFQRFGYCKQKEKKKEIAWAYNTFWPRFILLPCLTL